MITRYAFFGGRIKTGKEEAMRQYVLDVLAPLWRKFACAQ